MYTQAVMDHFKEPHNVGKMEDADAVGQVGNPTCGDVMYIYIKVKDNVITDIMFQTMGCAAAIATSSMVTDLAKGKTLDEAMKITRKDVAENLGGLPPAKMHCSNLAADALHSAIKDYREKNNLPHEAPESDGHDCHDCAGCCGAHDNSCETGEGDTENSDS